MKIDYTFFRRLASISKKLDVSMAPRLVDVAAVDGSIWSS